MEKAVGLLMTFILPVISFAAGEGGGHSHGSGGETEHLYPVIGVFVLLLAGGAAFHFLTKKK